MPATQEVQPVLPDEYWLVLPAAQLVQARPLNDENVPLVQSTHAVFSLFEVWPATQLVQAPPLPEVVLPTAQSTQAVEPPPHAQHMVLDTKSLSS